MNTKKMLAVLVSVAMCGAAFAGCGNNADSSKAESKSNNSSAVVSETAMPEKDYATTTDGSAKVKIDGTKFMVGDKELWFNGVNAPWDKWRILAALSLRVFLPVQTAVMLSSLMIILHRNSVRGITSSM